MMPKVEAAWPHHRAILKRFYPEILMQNTATFGKRAFTMAIVFATILWSVGVSFFMMPLSASAASVEDGDLIKGSLSTVYYAWDGERYTFPNEKTFSTWFADFDDVETISDGDLADIPLAGNIVYRSGTYMIKIDSDPKTYVVGADGAIQWVESEEVATDLFGSTWNTMIQDVPDVFFTDYSEGASLMEAALVEGMMIESDDVTYIYWGGELHELSADGMDANGLMSEFILTDSSIDVSDYTTGDDIDSEDESLSDASQMAEDSGSTSEGLLEVSLSSDSPDSSTLIATQGIADLAHFTFANDGTDDVTVTNLKFKRLGISGDTTLSAIYLYDGVARLTDSASVSSGVITFNDSSGLFTVGAGEETQVDLRSNILTGTTGQTVGVSITEATSVTASGADEIDGDFPLEGETHTIATVSDFGGFNFNSSTTPTTASVDPQVDMNVWQNTVSVTNNKQDIYSIRLRQIGSINSGDIENFRLYIDGVQAGDAVDALDSNGYVTFDLEDSPVTVQTGSRVIKVLADVIGGSSRTVNMSLRSTGDAYVVDQVYGQPIVALADSSTFSARTTGVQTLNAGSLTVARASSSPSGNVTNNSSAQHLATFDLKAFGEDMKVENLRISATGTDADGSGTTFTAYTMRSGSLYADGVQVGSTAAIAEDSDATLAYTEFSLGSSLTVSPGDPVELTVKADLYDNDGTNDVDAGDTVTINVAIGSSNVLRKVSNSYDSYPAAAVAANSLTIATGALALASNTSFASQTVVAPKSAQKVASYSVTSTTTEAVNINTFTLDFDGAAATDAADASSDLTNLYLVYGATGTETTSSVKGSVTDTANAWSVSYSLAAGSTIYINAYADAASSATNGDATADTLTTDLAITGTGANSAAAANATAVVGQTITFGAGTLTASLDGGTSVNKAVGANAEVSAAIFRFTSQNDVFNVRDVVVSIASTTVASAISSVRLYDGSTLLGSAPIGSSTTTAAIVSGKVFSVSSNSYKQITAKYVLNDIGTGLGTSQVNAVATLASYIRETSAGAQTSVTTTCTSADCVGNEVYVYKSVPTVTQVDLTNDLVSNGATVDIYKFTVSAASNGAVSLKQIKFPISWTDGATATDTLELESLKFYKDGSDITTSVRMQDEDGNSVESTSGLLEADGFLIVSWATEEVISAGSSVTYLVRATPQGFRVAGATDVANTDSVSLYLAGDSAHNGTSVFLNDETDIAAGQSTIYELFTSAAAASSDGSGVTNAGGSAQFIWSDNNLATHVSDANASSSGDWANGYLILSLDLSSEAWAR